MVVKYADGSDADHVAHLHRLVPRLRIYLLIGALVRRKIEAGAILTVHVAVLSLIISTPVIQFDTSAFVVTLDQETYRVALEEPAAATPSKVMFRKDDRYAVWDSKGLTVRFGKKTHSTRMEDAALSPRLFVKEQIVQTKRLIAAGVRQKGANALSGAKRIGSECFFLLRWDDSKGAPWLETLVRLDLAGDSMKPELLGTFPGRSLGKGKVDDRLGATFGLLSVVARKTDGSWGLATFNPASKEFAFNAFGTGLESFQPLSSRLGLFQERTAWGSAIVGRVDFGSAKRRTLMEVDSPVSFLDLDSPPIAKFEERGELVLRNADAASEKRLPLNTGVRRCKLGVLIWRPQARPTEAALMEPERWSVLSRWTAPNSQP